MKKVCILVLACLRAAPLVAQDFVVLCAEGTPAQIMAALKAGADGTAKDNAGKTAFEYAKDNAKLKDTPVYSRLDQAQR